MTTPVHDADLVRSATEELLSALVKLEGSAVPEPSQLPGWTRGHVLTHLARNADALLNVLAGKPMYASAEQREADIESGASRALDVQLDDLRVSSSRLDTAFAELAEDDWNRTAALRNGVTDRVSSLPFRRWREVELHHIDLGIGYTLEDLPGSFVDRQLTYMTDRFAGHPEISAALELRAEDGRSWRTGAGQAPADGPLVVAGSPVALVGWLTGRTSGSGLTARQPLPALPAL